MQIPVFYYILTFVLFISGFLLGKYLEKIKIKSIKDLHLEKEKNLNNQFENYKTQAEKNIEKLDFKNKDIEKLYHSLSIDYASLTSNYNALEIKLKEQKSEVDNMNLKFKMEFENLAQKILDEKSEKFTLQNKNNLDNIINPLKEKIKEFENKVENTHKESIEQQSALKQQILGLKELNITMSKETQNLTNALKKDTKLQGNWGELILEKVLEKSNLEKGREYTTQESFITEEGKKIPDVIVHLPDGKKIIIDSKVTLIAYTNFVNAENETQQSQYLKQHLLSVKTHIDQLSSKKYQSLYEMESPDFVLMFMPIETAFSTAIQEDQNLYNYAFDKNIVIVTPSTLLATLKVIDSLWQNEKQRKNTLEIAKQAGNLYDKFVGHLEDLEKLGKQLNTVSSTYTDSMKKLTGNQNLIKKVEQLKKLGVKASKTIPQKWLDKEPET